MDRQTLLSIARNRSESYWFLSRFFVTRPDEPFLSELRERLGPGAEAFEAAASGDLVSLRGALDDDGAEALTERLVREYTRLFRGLSEGRGPPPPYESVYRESRLMGEVTVAVIGRYAEAGYGTIDAKLGPQDHIGAELKFMSMLCYDELFAWENDDREAAVAALKHQRGFLDDHLLCWLPEYCRRLQEESREPFYASAASLTGQAIATDDEVLGDLLETLAVA